MKVGLGLGLSIDLLADLMVLGVADFPSCGDVSSFYSGPSIRLRAHAPQGSCPSMTNPYRRPAPPLSRDACWSWGSAWVGVRPDFWLFSSHVFVIPKVRKYADLFPYDVLAPTFRGGSRGVSRLSLALFEPRPELFEGNRGLFSALLDQLPKCGRGL